VLRTLVDVDFENSWREVSPFFPLRE